MKDLITVHHEMAHIQYFLRYSGLAREFRDGANPGDVDVSFQTCKSIFSVLQSKINIFKKSIANY